MCRRGTCGHAQRRHRRRRPPAAMPRWPPSTPAPRPATAPASAARATGARRAASRRPCRLPPLPLVTPGRAAVVDRELNTRSSLLTCGAYEACAAVLLLRPLVHMLPFFAAAAAVSTNQALPYLPGVQAGGKWYQKCCLTTADGTAPQLANLPRSRWLQAAGGQPPAAAARGAGGGGAGRARACRCLCTVSDRQESSQSGALWPGETETGSQNALVLLPCESRGQQVDRREVVQ